MKQPMISGPQAEWIREAMTKLHLWSKKEEIVKDFSATNATKIHALTQLEAEKLTCYMLDLQQQSENMRKALLSLGYQLHWDVGRTHAEKQMEPKRINYNRVNEWCMSSHSKHKKALNRLTPFALQDMVTQLKQILMSTKESANGEIRKSA